MVGRGAPMSNGGDALRKLPPLNGGRNWSRGGKGGMALLRSTSPTAGVRAGHSGARVGFRGEIWGPVMVVRRGAFRGIGDCKKG